MSSKTVDRRLFDKSVEWSKRASRLRSQAKREEGEAMRRHLIEEAVVIERLARELDELRLAIQREATPA